MTTIGRETDKYTDESSLLLFFKFVSYVGSVISVVEAFAVMGENIVVWDVIAVDMRLINRENE